VEIFPQRSHFVLGQLLKEKEVSKSGYNNFDTEVKQLDSSDKNLSDYVLSKYESSRGRYQPTKTAFKRPQPYLGRYGRKSRFFYGSIFGRYYILFFYY